MPHLFRFRDNCPLAASSNCDPYGAPMRGSTEQCARPTRTVLQGGAPTSVVAAVRWTTPSAGPGSPVACRAPAPPDRHERPLLVVDVQDDRVALGDLHARWGGPGRLGRLHCGGHARHLLTPTLPRLPLGAAASPGYRLQGKLDTGPGDTGKRPPWPPVWGGFTSPSVL